MWLQSKSGHEQNNDLSNNCYGIMVQCIMVHMMCIYDIMALWYYRMVFDMVGHQSVENAGFRSMKPVLFFYLTILTCHITVMVLWYLWHYGIIVLLYGV